MSDPMRGLSPASFARSEFEAQTQAAILREANIDAFVFPSTNWSGVMLSPDAKGVPVFVPHADVERAAAILEQHIADSVDLDWESVDVGGEAPDEAGAAPSRGMPWLARMGMTIGLVLVGLILFGWVIGCLPFLNISGLGLPWSP